MFGSIDNKFSRYTTTFMYVLWLSLLWLVCSLPLVTIGASTTALCSVTLKLARNEEGYITQSFFKAFRQNLAQATGLWLIWLAVAVVFAGDAYFFTRYFKGMVAAIGAGLFLCLLLVWCLAQTLLFNLQAHYKNNLKQTLFNSVKMALRHLPVSGALLILQACMLYGFYASAPLMIVLTFVGAGLFQLVAGHLLRRVFDGYEPQTV